MRDDIESLIEAGDALVIAMEMQEGRELETLHINQATAKKIWDAAKSDWKNAVMEMYKGLV